MLIFGHGTEDPDNLINSRASFSLVRETGADGVELDVRLCADGSLAVIHDPHLPDGRPTAELRAGDFPDDLLQLHEALDLCRGMIVNVELKNHPRDVDFDPEEHLAERAVETLGDRHGRDEVILSSFGMGCIDRVRRLDPTIKTAHLVLSRRSPLELIDDATSHGHHVIHPYLGMVTEDFVATAHAAAVEVNVWTGLDEPAATTGRLIDLGVHAMITPYPGRAMRLRHNRTRQPRP